MKLDLAISGSRIAYRIETTVILPNEIMESCKVTIAEFSPNPFDPVTVYLVPRSEPNFQNLIDTILDSEVNAR